MRGFDFFKRPSPEVPLVQALAWIVGSVLLVTGTAHLCLQHQWLDRLPFCSTIPSHPMELPETISVLVQTGPQKEALKTQYLAELLELSADRPTQVDAFDCHLGEQRLLACPLIAKAHVKLMPTQESSDQKRIKPQTHAVYVDYTIRQPVAWLSDYENIAVDREGYPFPFRPFFSPKHLPALYFGLKNPMPDQCHVQWHHPIQGKYVALAFDLLNRLNGPPFEELCTIEKIDVSAAYATSYGKREIVVTLEDLIIVPHTGQEIHYYFPKILRLSTKNYHQELANYLKLRESLLEQEKKEISLELKPGVLVVHAEPKVLDFRIPNLAFIPKKK